MEKLKVAIIGCGNVSRVHLAAASASKQADLIAVCDVKKDRADKAAELHNAPAYYDFREVLDLNPDVIHICTPHHTHAEIAIAAANKGINVLTEKPMAVTLADADRMIKAAEENDIYLGVIFQNRYNPSSMAVKEVVASGQLGKLLGARMFVTWFRSDEYYSKSDWKGTWDKEGGGVLIDQAIHTIDLMQWIVGDIDQIQASIDNRTHDIIDVEDVAEATIHFKNGTIGSLYAVNYYTYDADVFLEVHGENGVARIEKDVAYIRLVGEEERVVRPESLPKAIGKSYWGVSHKTQIEQYYQTVRTNGVLDIDGTKGRKALEIVRAIYYSGNNGACKVQFPFAEPEGFVPRSLTRK